MSLSLHLARAIRVMRGKAWHRNNDVDNLNYVALVGGDGALSSTTRMVDIDSCLHIDGKKNDVSVVCIAKPNRVEKCFFVWKVPKFSSNPYGDREGVAQRQ